MFRYHYVPTGRSYTITVTCALAWPLPSGKL
jgi:hypothetical protein